MSSVATSNGDRPQHDHVIDPDMLDPAAVSVTEQLQKAGFEALLVGGCVRDLLLGHAPKDYDVATDATPEQIKALFRRSRIIGRRFRIVHVRMGREVIEVTTFRGVPRSGTQNVSRDGRVLDDNVWGDLDSDAERRDFTVNALYYDPVKDEGIDHVDGLHDLEDGILRMIGNPEKRFAEDPVRVLRAIRFMAKLGFNIEGETERAMRAAVPLLDGVPAARLFDEMLKLFHHGQGEETCRLLHHYGVLKRLFPVLRQELSGAVDEVPLIISKALNNTDRRVQSGKPVIAAFLFAAFLWPPVSRRMAELIERGRPAIESLHRAADTVISEECSRISIPRRVSGVVKEIWELECRLRERRAKNIVPLLENRRFRAAFDFLLLRTDIGDGDKELLDWWDKIQTVDHIERDSMIDALRQSGGGGGRRRRRPRKRPAGRTQH